MLNFQITTPERVVFKDQVDKVSLPTELGQITVLPGHIPLVANLVPGELQIHRKSDVIPFAVSGGFVEVRPGNHVIVLSDAAEHAEEIDIARAEEAAESAKKLMEGIAREDVKFAEAAAALERSLARLRVARKRRHARGIPPMRIEG